MVRDVARTISYGAVSGSKASFRALKSDFGGRRMQTIGTQKTQPRAVTMLACLLLSLFGIFTTAVCRAQTTQQFTGRVVDSTGAVVPAADVLIHNQSTAEEEHYDTYP